VTGELVGTVQVGRGPSGLAVGAGQDGWHAHPHRSDRSTVADDAAGRPRAGGGRRERRHRLGRQQQRRHHLAGGGADDGGGCPISVGAGPRGVVASRGSVWVAYSLELTVSRIDVRRMAATATVPVGESPAAGPSGWPTAAGRSMPPHGTPPSAHSPRRPCSACTTGSSPCTRRGGADGYDLVPNLARTLPTPTDGGRTYTFTLRRGIRYSDGRFVRPADFRRGLTRAFTAAGGDAGGLLAPDPTGRSSGRGPAAARWPSRRLVVGRRT